MIINYIIIIISWSQEVGRGVVTVTFWGMIMVFVYSVTEWIMSVEKAKRKIILHMG